MFYVKEIPVEYFSDGMMTAGKEMETHGTGQVQARK
jgi:hypothetical protein